MLITLDRGRGTPLRAQLEDQFRKAIRSGRLGSGEQVPSSRVLASMLGLSRAWCKKPTRSSKRRAIWSPGSRIRDPGGLGGHQDRTGQAQPSGPGGTARR
jgi:DNA-binding transcriptional MocR family regulator